MLRTICVLLAFFLTPLPAPAAESYDNCIGFIDSLPATIGTQGTWCLRQDLSTTMAGGSAITITTNNVTIDCNDFKLGGLGAGPGTAAMGIRADGRLNATIRHCNVRGFRFGIFLAGNGGGGDAAGSGGHVVEDNRFNGNTQAAIFVNGDGSVVRRNLVADTGGASSALPEVAAIRTWYGVDVLDNTVSGVAASVGDSSTFGIASEDGGGADISGNRVRGVLRAGAGQAIGIATTGAARLAGNYVRGDGSEGSVGLFCFNGLGRAMDNITSGVAIHRSGCGNAGGNDPEF